MDKVNFKKELAHLYNPKNIEWQLVRVPTMNFLMVDGKGDPNTAPDYADAVEALYGVSYAIKLLSRRTLGRDYVVPPLEGMWSSDDSAAFTQMNKDKYSWAMMIMQPDWIARARFARAIEPKKARRDLPALSRVRFEPYAEGRALQLIHIGSYDDEAPKLKQLHDEYLPEHDLTPNGPHHEIYLSDPRKTPPAQRKTILRQPIKQL